MGPNPHVPVCALPSLRSIYSHFPLVARSLASACRQRAREACRNRFGNEGSSIVEIAVCPRIAGGSRSRNLDDLNILYPQLALIFPRARVRDERSFYYTAAIVFLCPVDCPSPLLPVLSGIPPTEYPLTPPLIGAQVVRVHSPSTNLVTTRSSYTGRIRQRSW